MVRLNLLPYPRHLEHRPGHYTLPKRAVIRFGSSVSAGTATALFHRLRSAAETLGVQLARGSSEGSKLSPALLVELSSTTPEHPEDYVLAIAETGIRFRAPTEAGLRAAVATLRQLWRECGRKLPRLTIRDYPDFERRGVMLDVSRGRVPNRKTLLALLDDLADFKINEFQLYTEHTFAYRRYKPVWQGWGPLTAADIRALDTRCGQLGIDLVPNQNSFGHLRCWLEYPPLRKLAETSQPYEGHDGTYLRYPTTLAPNHPDTVPFLRALYNELLPNFRSRFFNVGCDETWDLGLGQSKARCEKVGKSRVYLDFVKKIHREVTRRGHQMMFWGDIVLKHPELIKELPRNVIAMNWGYEIDHPFESETSLFAKAKVPFYVCPGTATWMTLIGRHDTAIANLKAAAAAGHRHGAIGYLITDWGDGGHPQPLAVSYLPYLVGAAVSWCGKTFDEKLLVPVLSRDVFQDPTRHVAEAAYNFGFAHLKFDYLAKNVTPFGTVIAAPKPETRELMCRDGLKYYARIPEKSIRAGLEELKRQRALLRSGKPGSRQGAVLQQELALAARMAAQSCHIMLWQQALAAGNSAGARRLAARGIRELSKLERDFRRFWPLRNKGTPLHSTPFFRWRADDYRQGTLHFAPAVASLTQPGNGAEA